MGDAVTVGKNQVFFPTRDDGFVQNTTFLKIVVFLSNMLNLDIDLRLDRFQHVPGLLRRSIVSHDDFKITIRLSRESAQRLFQPLGMVVGRNYYRGKH